MRELTVGYHRDIMILRRVSLEAARGRITAVLGANGAGKSTLLRTIYGYLRPSSGTIELDGEDIVGRAPHEMIRLGLAYISQRASVFSHMTVEENLRIGAWTFRKDRRRIARKLEENLERFPILREKRREQAWTLSGGEQRMVEIACVLMTDPRVILVDEPTAGLAKTVAASVYRMLARLRDEGITILLVDQEIRQALRIADHVYVLDVGRNRSDGPARDFFDIEKAFWV
ncbi:MAG TPA: ABC transporter ATP-binding protein [Actinomycetota bacterium]|nr:ABC transporter ATP-binding protein [Actinomycetota bacterium]